LQVMSFPGLSVDNVTSTPGASGTSSASGSGTVNQQVAQLSQQLVDLKTAQQSQVDAVNQNTQALGRSGGGTPAATGSASGTSAGSIVTDVLGTAFGLSPIFKGLLDLFGGSSQTAAVQPLVPFSLPPSIQYSGAVGQNGSVTPADYGQNGRSRSLGSQSGASSSNPSQAATTVQINVNAMDSRSFLDHSDDIAQAVRQALLTSNSLGDVIADL
jgi:hypothetical protein